ncbi:MAG: RNA polymerase sigma factor [Phycisphaerae bacterium]|nr:RNA polymerase sigma factor [Phycisphaerae bacterium]MDW8261979.1 RNA polymerase sigma factor [Phycisphaerales bacterium]
MPTDESLLIRDLKNGSARAYQLVLEKHGPSLLRLATALLGNAADAEDVLQQTMLSSLTSIGSFRGEAALKTWLTRILLNQISRVRKQRATRSALSLERDLPPTPPARGSVSSLVAAKADVMTMLASLSSEHRDILTLRELEGLSYREIADVLGIPQGTVESRLFRAREQLKQKFAGYEYE